MLIAQPGLTSSLVAAAAALALRHYPGYRVICFSIYSVCPIPIHSLDKPVANTLSSIPIFLFLFLVSHIQN